MSVDIFLGFLQEIAEALRGVMEAGNVSGALGREPWAVVPPDRRAWEDRNIECLIHLRTDFQRIGSMYQIVGIEAAHVVESLAVNA